MKLATSHIFLHILMYSNCPPRLNYATNVPCENCNNKIEPTGACCVSKTIPPFPFKQEHWWYVSAHSIRDINDLLYIAEQSAEATRSWIAASLRS